jgi:hypothetical protein
MWRLMNHKELSCLASQIMKMPRPTEWWRMRKLWVWSLGRLLSKGKSRALVPESGMKV